MRGNTRAGVAIFAALGLALVTSACQPGRSTVAPTNAPGDFQPEFMNRVAMDKPLSKVSSNSVTLYDCPARTCGVVRTLAANTPASAIAYVNGEVISPGQAIWYEMDGGGYAYIEWFD